MKFKPGESGNPGGRPKTEAEVLRLARDASPEAVKRLIKWMKSEDPRASIAASNAILDRAIGKPKQAVELDGDIGVTVQILKFANSPASE